MDKLGLIYNAIGEWSNRLIDDAGAWSKQLGGSKNYVCTPDLKHWTYSKSVADEGEYDYDGGVAKDRLYRLGFKNILQSTDSQLSNQIIEAFIAWAEKVNDYPISEKFRADQLSLKRFELLVHHTVLDQLAKNILAERDKQQEFDEGFRKQIKLEVAKRNQKLVKLAKQHYGAKCAVCEFEFGEKYGSHGSGFIEIHHLYPIAKGPQKTTLADVRPVCANCHRMLHRGDKILSIIELKNIIDKK